MNRHHGESWRTTGWVVALAIGCLTLPRTGFAQEDGKPGVVEEDLGDGFRAVSVNGGPPAIIDDATGMILKEAYGRPIIHDPETGATLYLDDDGQLAIKGGAPQGGAGAEPSRRVERMKAFWQRAQAYSRARGGAGPGEAGDAEPSSKAPRRPPAPWDEVVAVILDQLEVDEESKLIVAPRLRAVLLARDAIQRSAAPLTGQEPATTRPASRALPAAIRDYLRAFQASLGEGRDAAALERGLAGYRAARKAQDDDLAGLQERLREVVTLPQEARLVALGILP